MDKRILPRAKDRITFLYVNKARIEQTEFAIKIVQANRQVTEIPISTISTLFLGPGTSITHAAIKNICNVGCSVVWCGTGGWRFYSCGIAATNSNKNILLQAEYYASKMKHMDLVRRMYLLRYPEEHLKSKTTAELRGLEGYKVQQLYQKLSAQYNVDWNGRQYSVGEFVEQDLINQCLTFSNQVLYGIVRSVISILGFSPAIGFIHTGHIDSFVFDIADLYKEKTTIIAAFKYCSKHNYFNEDELLRMLRHEFNEINLMKTIVKDILTLFDTNENNVEIELQLWDKDGSVPGGINYQNKL
ncbi:MAG: type I-E CRISPR-associated endonuclease Cas1 [Agathobacter sp.]|nr:type I-E CRISPR-associated endonuclease Cas1 [Agathobacter sp.]